jgi:hypothetical protein
MRGPSLRQSFKPLGMRGVGNIDEDECKACSDHPFQPHKAYDARVVPLFRFDNKIGYGEVRLATESDLLHEVEDASMISHYSSINDHNKQWRMGWLAVRQYFRHGRINSCGSTLEAV